MRRTGTGHLVRQVHQSEKAVATARDSLKWMGSSVPKLMQGSNDELGPAILSDKCIRARSDNFGSRPEDGHPSLTDTRPSDATKGSVAKPVRAGGGTSLGQRKLTGRSAGNGLMFTASL